MRVKPIKVSKVINPFDDLFKVLGQIRRLPEESVLVTSSKVVSICEGNVIPIDSVASIDDLIATQAKQYIPRKLVPHRYGVITVKNSTLLFSSGIDRFGKHFVLWPKNPEKSAQKIQEALRKKWKIQKLGVIIVDSHTIPLRRGTLGFAVGYYGFKPLRVYRGTYDLFGKEMKITQANIVDALAAAAVAEMGEGGERTPLALITEISGLKFINRTYKPTRGQERLETKVNEDYFRPILTNPPWKKARNK